MLWKQTECIKNWLNRSSETPEIYMSATSWSSAPALLPDSSVHSVCYPHFTDRWNQKIWREKLVSVSSWSSWNELISTKTGPKQTECTLEFSKNWRNQSSEPAEVHFLFFMKWRTKLISSTSGSSGREINICNWQFWATVDSWACGVLNGRVRTAASLLNSSKSKIARINKLKLLYLSTYLPATNIFMETIHQELTGK